MIPYSRQFVDEKDIKEVVKVLKSPYLTQGPKILETEKYISKYVGSKYAVLVSSCSLGLHIACKAIDIKKKVITTPISFVSTANSATHCGAKVIFSDIDTDTINLSPHHLSKTLKNNSNVKCVIPVHMAYASVNMKEIYNISKFNKLKIIKDAAHALGAKYENGSKVGSCKYSDMTVFSFHPVKIITGGEGGVVTTNNFKIYQKLLELRSHGIYSQNKKFKNKSIAYTNGIKNIWYYEMSNPSFHYRITDIQSSLILSQIKKINKFLKHRKKIAIRYDQYFKKIDFINVFQEKLRSYSSNHLYILNIDFNKFSINRNKFMKYLRKKEIITQVHYIPIYYQPFYKINPYSIKKLKIQNTTKIV